MWKKNQLQMNNHNRSKRVQLSPRHSNDLGHPLTREICKNDNMEKKYQLHKRSINYKRGHPVKKIVREHVDT